jgi:hypothetical protein
MHVGTTVAESGVNKSASQAGICPMFRVPGCSASPLGLEVSMLTTKEDHRTPCACPTAACAPAVTYINVTPVTMRLDNLMQPFPDITDMGPKGGGGYRKLDQS